MLNRTEACCWLIGFSAFSASVPAAEQNEADLAKKLSNPVAELISVPLQYNFDHEFGTERDGERSTLNIQPVAPVTLNENWNVISRTILPVIHQTGIVPGTSSKSGIGDITQSLFFSPSKPTAGGVIWGAGPAFLLPSASDDQLGTEKWGLGPTIVVLKQQHEWTYGLLANHIWSVAGDEHRADINSTFLQPFLSHTTATAWTYGLNTESTYDWHAEEWSVPLNVTVAKLTKLGRLPTSFTVGARYWADSPETGPHGWGLRLVVTFLFPK
jgi:hypothetical protein